MKDKRLTYQQYILLQQQADGELSDELSKKRAEQLIEVSEHAKDFSNTVQVLGESTRAAEAQIWETSGIDLLEVDFPEEQKIDDADISLEMLYPVLERYHDGEALAHEIERIESLREKRADINGYLGMLSELEKGVQISHDEILSEGLDFSKLWSRIESEIEARQNKPLSDEERVLLYRFADGEASEKEAGRAKILMDENPGAESVLDVLSEICLATNVAVEHAQENADLSQIWTHIEASLDTETSVDTREKAQVHNNVVSITKAREDKKSASTQKSKFKRELFVAAAAAVFAVIGVGLFSDKLFQGERVVVEKTIVIVDSVEYQQGISGRIIGAKLQKAEAATNKAQVSGAETQEEEEVPTVLWIADPEDEDAKTSETHTEGDKRVKEDKNKAEPDELLRKQPI